MGIKKGLNPRLAEIGKIKLGGLGAKKKSKNGKEFQLPVRYDHFVITETGRGADGNFLPKKELMDKLGENPKSLKIRLLRDSIDGNFYTAYAYYQGRQCLCRGDGETAERLATQSGTWETLDGQVKVEPGNRYKIKCDTETCPFYKEDKCKIGGILECILADDPQLGGVYRFRTHGWHSVNQIMASLTSIAEVTGGVLRGIPLVLQIVKVPTEKHGDATTATVLFDGESYEELQRQAIQEAQRRKQIGVDMQAIEAIKIEDTDDPADVAAEFYPEAPPKPETVEEKTDAVLGDVKPFTPPEDKPVEGQDEKKTEPASDGSKKEKDETTAEDDLF